MSYDSKDKRRRQQQMARKTINDFKNSGEKVNFKDK